MALAWKKCFLTLPLLLLVSASPVTVRAAATSGGPPSISMSPVIGSGNRAVVQPGDTQQIIIGKLGQPHSLASMGGGARILMDYPEGQIILENGRATMIPAALQGPPLPTPAPVASVVSPASNTPATTVPTATTTTPTLPTAPVSLRAVIRLGDTKADIEARLGPAPASAGSDAQLTLFYPDGQIILQNDHATQVDQALLDPAPAGSPRTAATFAPAPASAPLPAVTIPVNTPGAQVTMTASIPSGTAKAPASTAAKPAGSAGTAKPAGSSGTAKPAAPKTAPPPEDTGFSIPSYVYVAVALILAFIGLKVWDRVSAKRKARATPATPAAGNPAIQPGMAGSTAAEVPVPEVAAPKAAPKTIPLPLKKAAPPAESAPPPPAPVAATPAPTPAAPSPEAPRPKLTMPNKAAAAPAATPPPAPPAPTPATAPTPPSPVAPDAPRPKLTMPNRAAAVPPAPAAPVEPKPVESAPPATPAAEPKTAEPPRLGLKLNRPATPPPQNPPTSS